MRLRLRRPCERLRIRRLAVVLLAVVLWAPATPSAGAEIKVLSAGAMRSMVAELGEAFRQETGHTIAISTGTAGEIRQKVTAGDSADVVIVTDTVLEQLATSGLVVSDTRADIARTGIGVAVREGEAQVGLRRRPTRRVRPLRRSGPGGHPDFTWLKRLGRRSQAKSKGCREPSHQRSQLGCCLPATP